MAMLTGGTGDVKPEVMSFKCTQSAADTTTSIQQTLPIMRNFSSQNRSRAQVIEVLKVFFWVDNSSVISSAVSVYLSTKNFAATATNFGEPTVFAAAQYRELFTTSGESNTPNPLVYDCQDGSGNGFLVATDSIYAQVVSASTSAANTVYIKMLYRVYGASVTEYVGIVQGQQ